MASKHKNRIFITVLTGLLCLSAVLLIASVCSVRVGLRLFVDGRQIGVVESAADVDAIRRRVITDISDAAYGENFGNCTVTYGFVEGSDAAKTLTEDEIYKALFIASLKNYRYAYGVYVNGSFIAANTEPSAIADAITSCRSAAQGGTDAEVELVGAFDIKELYYPTATLKTPGEISRSLLSLSDQLYRTVPHEQPGYVSVNIDAHVDENHLLSPEGGEIIATNKNEDGGMTVSIKVTESIPFTTEYRRNEDLFIGTYQKVQDGADGVKEVTYNIIYEDGIPVSREKVCEQTVLEPLPKVIDEGTKTKPSTSTKTNYEWPIKRSYTLTDTFGGRTVFGKYSFHYAIDIAVPGGTPIYASNGGVVTKAEWSGSFGYYVVILHDNGQETLYAHMRTEPIVSVGERVYQGQQIGEVGMTGYATGYHLHFEIHIDGERVDPLKYLP